MKTTIVIYDKNGMKTEWLPTTLDKIGKNEKDLEDVLAKTPALLNLESKRTGIYGPYATFQQLSFSTPQSRNIIPDILFLTASGNVVVVEVKRFINPELKDRRVIAQAIDYAASLSALSEKELSQLFSKGEKTDFFSLVTTLFEKEEDAEELASTLLSNIKSGNIHIIIACDKVPPGLYELAKSVSMQSVLSFSLEILEVTPFSSNFETSESIMYVPNTRLSTEIVARTAITVTSAQDAPKPNINIETTSIEEIERNLASSTSRNRKFSKPIWFIVNGEPGAELPTFFKRCITSLRRDGALEIVLDKDVDGEEKIDIFKKHYRYEDFTTNLEVSPEEWETIFTSIRVAKSTDLTNQKN